jgi:GxxExxY protein
VNREVPIEIRYKDMTFDEAFRADIVVDEKVIGAKVSGASKRSAQKQVQNYLRLTGYKLGFLLSFGEALMKRGITRVVNGPKDE